MFETSITVRIDPELKTAFARAAEAHRHTDEDFLREFQRDYVETQRADSEYEQWFCSQVQAGIDEADAGNVIPSEEVEAEFAALRAGCEANFLRPAR